MTETDVPRYNVLGVGVSALTFDRACKLIIGAKGSTRTKYVCLCTVHGIDETRRDPAYRIILNQSWLTTADGMPIVWLGPPKVERVYGPDLMLAVCDLGRATGLRHYLYGGKAGVADELSAILTSKFPGLSVVGTHSPPFREASSEDIEFIKAEVERVRPDVIWVGLGTPKQERFMAGPGLKLNTAVLVGVGAAFDFHTGHLAQAPRWMQQIGLEWFFRLCTEPRRLAGRYIRTNSAFIVRLFLAKIGLRRYPLD
jgi:N-acetylglucosaminyldiphosphoundecaprenol N-acetyl-beta-D-mannosaminyltransferase